MTRDIAQPVGSRDTVSTRSLKEPLRAALAARPGGLREPLLLALVSPDPRPTDSLPRYAAATSSAIDSPVLRKMRNALKRLGAVRDDDLRWTLTETAKVKRETRLWTRERCLAAMLAWHAEHGALPTSYQWRTGGGGARPVHQSVADAFGSWSAGIAAAESALRRAA